MIFIPDILSSFETWVNVEDARMILDYSSFGGSNEKFLLKILNF